MSNENMTDTAHTKLRNLSDNVLQSAEEAVKATHDKADQLFDAAGQQQISAITLTASDIWNAGSEAFSIAGAAFLVNGNNDLRTDENGVVGLRFAPLSGFNGETTAAGYVFDSQLGADTSIYRIGFTVTPVPEPQTYVLMAAGLLTLLVVSRRRAVRA